jgi:HK97 gp10 family phage protein
MADPVSIVGDGLNEWIKAANEKVHEATAKGVATVVEHVVAKAKDLCPVASGNLRDSISGSVSAGKHFGFIRSDSKKAYYNFMVHWGTSRMPGRPFMTQAAEQSKTDLETEIQRNLKE